jgi:hypothetical protein
MGSIAPGACPAEGEEGPAASAAPAAAGSREALMASMLRACGERGYRGVRLEELGADASGFRDEAECFASGYASEGERLRRLVARAAREGSSPRQMLEAVLAGLSGFIGERPAAARSLLAEVHVAGGRAARERRRLLADLARAIEETYREEATAPPLPDSAAFMVEVIETVALRAALAGDARILAGAIPDLARMLEDLYGPA